MREVVRCDYCDADCHYNNVDGTCSMDDEDFEYLMAEGELPLLSARKGPLYYVLAILSCLSLAFFATLQIIAFKKLGYAFAPYPYFILLSVSFMFVPIFFSGVLFLRVTTGGFLPETTTWLFKRHYAIIGCCNAMNGVLLIFANPHTPGTVQAIFTQTIIPFVMIISIIVLRTKFNMFQVFFIFYSTP